MLLLAVLATGFASLVSTMTEASEEETRVNQEFIQGWDFIEAAHYATKLEETKHRRLLNKKSFGGVQEMVRATPELHAGVAETSTIPRSIIRPVPGEVLSGFAQGYREAGGPGQWLDHFLYDVIWCESKNNPYAVSPNGLYYGLVQFEVYFNGEGEIVGGTWHTVASVTGLWNVYDPYHQGFNTAVLITQLRASPHGQWPRCWYS